MNIFFDNFKVTLTEAPVVARSDYYPFGMLIEGLSHATASAGPNKYLYNGKELQDDQFGGVSLEMYDYGARMYDPQLGRWNAIDPMGEKTHPLSPYNYVANHPTGLTDPNGQDWTIGVTRDGSGNITGVHFTLNAVIYNSSSNRYGSGKAQAFENAVRTQIQSVFSGTASDDINLNISIDVNLKTVNSIAEIGEKDHILEVVDPGNPVLAGEAARSPFYGLRTYISSALVDPIINYQGNSDDILVNNRRSVAHELGHTLGWFHPNDRIINSLDPRQKLFSVHPPYEYNLMYPFDALKRVRMDPNSARDIRALQIRVAIENRDAGRLNRQTNFGLKYVSDGVLHPRIPLGSTNGGGRFILDRSRLMYPKN